VLAVPQAIAHCKGTTIARMLNSVLFDDDLHCRIIKEELANQQASTNWQLVEAC
jgi:hypothetical protein